MSKPRHKARWTITRFLDDYDHLDYTNPDLKGEGRHRDSDDD